MQIKLTIQEVERKRGIKAFRCNDHFPDIKLPLGQPGTGCVEKIKITVVPNKNNELIPTHTITR